MSLLDSALQLDTTSITVGFISAILLFKVFFKNISELLESAGYWASLSFLSSSRSHIEGRTDTKLFIWLGLSIAMAFATSAFLDPLPQKIDFQGTTLAEREDNNDSLNKEIDVFSYRNPNNTKVLTIASVNNSDISLADFRQRYLSNFERQGINFKQQGNRYLGSKANTQLYITENYMLGALLIYAEQSNNGMPTLTTSKDTFAALEALEL